MKRFLVMMACAAGLVAVPVRADDAAKKALAEELLSVMDIQKNVDQVFAMMRQQMQAQMKRDGLATTNASLEFMDVIQAELSWEKLKPHYIELYTGTFTEAEMQGVIDFYKSPAGVAFLGKQPELMRRSMELNQQLMAELTPKLQALLVPKPKPAAVLHPTAQAAPAAPPAAEAPAAPAAEPIVNP
jgi:hypothetical protein